MVWHPIPELLLTGCSLSINRKEGGPASKAGLSLVDAAIYTKSRGSGLPLLLPCLYSIPPCKGIFSCKSVWFVFQCGFCSVIGFCSVYDCHLTGNESSWWVRSEVGRLPVRVVSPDQLTIRLSPRSRPSFHRPRYASRPPVYPRNTHPSKQTQQLACRWHIHRISFVYRASTLAALTTPAKAEAERILCMGRAKPRRVGLFRLFAAEFAAAKEPSGM